MCRNDIVQFGQRHNVSIGQILLVVTFAHPYLVILCHRTHGFGQSLAGHQYTCHESRGNSTAAHDHNSQFALSGLHVCSFHKLLIKFFRVINLQANIVNKCKSTKPFSVF